MLAFFTLHPTNCCRNRKVKNTNRSLLQKERHLLIVCLVFLLGFLLVTLFRTSFHSVDIAVNLWTPSIQSSALTFFAEGIALIFDTTSLIIFSLVISGLLFLKKLQSSKSSSVGCNGWRCPTRFSHKNSRPCCQANQRHFARHRLFLSKRSQRGLHRFLLGCLLILRGGTGKACVRGL